jgi:hypothetical protein
LPRYKKLKKIRSKVTAVSRENYSGEQYLVLLFIQQPNTWFSVEECEKYLEKKRKKRVKGTVYNLLWMLRQREIIESDGGMPVRHRLLRKGSESHPIAPRRRGKFGPLEIKIDIASYLKTLRFEDVSRIHDIKLWAPIKEVDFIRSTDRKWRYIRTRRVYVRRELVERKYRFVFEVYDKALTLVVSVACTNNPIAVDFAGLNRFYSVLCGVRASYFNSPSVPHVGDWVVKQWHFGKDAKSPIDGLCFETTWHNLHGDLVRVYASKGRVRVERVESPDDFVENLLGSPVSSIKKISGELTCVEVVPPAVPMKFAMKMLTVSDSSDVVYADTFSMTQELHM